MIRIQEAVRAYLEQAVDIPTVSDRTRVRGEYPLLAVEVQEKGSVLISGGHLAEHDYQVSVHALSDRDREHAGALLSALMPHLLRGIPMMQEGAQRTLHPLHITTEEDSLTFSLEVCVPVPPLSTDTPEAAHSMETLHFSVSE